MRYMEIALLSKNGLRFKSKLAAFAVDPQDKSDYDAIFLLVKSPDEITSQAPILITGPGEYEIGGSKITASRSEKEILYSLTLDSIDILLGTLTGLEKMQHKLKEHHIVVVDCNTISSASFVTSLASNVIIFYGEKATEIAQAFGKESVKSMTKYSSTLEKLPGEVETILLATSD